MAKRVHHEEIRGQEGSWRDLEKHKRAHHSQKFNQINSPSKANVSHIKRPLKGTSDISRSGSRRR